MPFEMPPAGRVPLCVPDLGGNEWTYLKECLDTNMVSSVGPFVGRFEKMVAHCVGANHAVATVNGTAGLHLALRLAGVGCGDEVLVSTLTFIAPANAIRYQSAYPVFVDAEFDHAQMDPAVLVRFLREGCELRDQETFNRTSGRRVKAVLPVHILGHPVDLDPIREIAREFHLAVVEDASEALGASYRGHAIGSGEAPCVFSFNGNKIITTGGGGMLTTSDRHFAERARHLSTQAKADPVECEHDDIGYNYRLTNLQAAVGCAQMESLKTKVRAKKAIAARYQCGLADTPGIQIMAEASWADSTHWLFTVLVDEQAYGMTSRALLRLLAENYIEARPLWQPLHRSPAHADAFMLPCPVSDLLWDRALSLPCSVGLSESQQSRVIECIQRNRCA